MLGSIAIWRLLRPGRVRWLPWDATARVRLAAMGVLPPRQADGLIMGEAERAAIPFRRCGRVLLGLGDPSGEETDRVSAIWRLRDLAQQEGLDPAFWRAGPGLLKVYGDLGLTALPLGRDGLPLPEAPDETPQAAALPGLHGGARPGHAVAAAAGPRPQAGRGGSRRGVARAR